jgi:chromate transporter
MIAVSESTPGPIMVNLATYVGSSQAGIAGAAVATLAVVLPAFFIIVLVATVLKAVIKNPYVQAVMDGLSACVVGVVLATGIYMTFSNCVPAAFDFRGFLIAAVLAATLFGTKMYTKIKLSPIHLILIAACLGAIVYTI